VALARHYRDVEQLSIAEIASRLGRSPETVKAYLYDPTGAKAREVKARYQGVCRGCGSPTQPRNARPVPAGRDTSGRPRSRTERTRYLLSCG
jgi:hypothetical protein